MGNLADVRLGNSLEVLGPQTLFHNGDVNRSSLIVNSPATGAATVTAFSGVAATDNGGFYLCDRSNKKRIAALRNGTAIDPDDMESMRIFLDAEYGNAVLGGGGKDGDLVLRNESGQVSVHISSGGGVEGNQVHRIVTTNANFKYNGALGIQELRGPIGGRLQLYNNSSQLKIELNGQDGVGLFQDIRLGQGTDLITSLLSKIKNLESRIVALEARR